MADDIVARLRILKSDDDAEYLAWEAAREIERLNTELARIRKLDIKAFENWQKREKSLLEEIGDLRATLTDLLGAVDALPTETVDPHSVRDARAALLGEKADG